MTGTGEVFREEVPDETHTWRVGLAQRVVMLSGKMVLLASSGFSGHLFQERRWTDQTIKDV